MQMDEILSAPEPVLSDKAEVLVVQARQMLPPDENEDNFQQQYYRSLQEFRPSWWHIPSGNPPDDRSSTKS
jgi:hypothetical protein